MSGRSWQGFIAGLGRGVWMAALVAGLAACGGGGGGTRADPPPQAPPPTPPPSPPVVEPPNPAFGDHIAWTGADAAHAAGLTGAGIRIGIIDSGVNRNHPALAGRVVSNLTYINPNTNNLSADDVIGHGTAVAQVVAGRAFGQWPGGIAPGAEIVSARIISDTPPEDDGSGQGNELNGPLGVASVHQDLMNRGVRVMNNSWGGLYWTNPNVSAQVAAEYRPFIATHGGLVVFSAGNSDFDDPSDTAALPSQPGPGGTMPAADLERGWLVVAALDGDDPTRLAEYSNACGIAMHYCLVAPGTVVVTGTDNAPNAPDYWRWSGTSFAAPIVSGAAALVWEAFPYFDNDLVRQTLLGTATDLGDAGVDRVFGYGALDIAAAIRGPARFDWGDVRVAFDGITSVWSNDISGTGALIKEGTGTLVIDANTTNDGGIVVRGGTLRAERSVFGDVLVEEAGTYAIGTHVLGVNVQGNVANAGRIEVIGHGSNRAVSSLVGDYLHRQGATLAFDLGQGLAVTGTATIEGGDLHVMGVKPTYTVASREVLIEAQEGLTGTFDQLTWASSLFLEGSLGYDSNLVWLDITRLDVAATAKSLAGITASGLSAAHRVERTFDGIDRALSEGRASVADEFVRIAGEFQGIGDEAMARAALDSLSGESHALAATLTFDAIDMGRRALSSRFGRFEGRDERIGVWKQALGHGGSSGFAGGGYRPDGWLLGRDQPLGTQSVAGFAFGETRTDDRVGDNRDRSRDRQAHGMAYAGRLSGAAYVLGQFGFGRFDRIIERNVFAGDAARQGVFSLYSGDYSSLGVEVGSRRRLGGLHLTPYAGAEHTRLRQDGFVEWGGDGFGLQARAASMQRTQAIAGLRVERDWRGATFRAYGEWQQTLSAGGFAVDASFTGIDIWSPLPVADAAKSGGLFGIGVDVSPARNTRLSFGFDQRFGPRGDESMASMRYVLGF